MYPNYIENGKVLGYETIIDTTCGKSLFLITDSTVLFVKNVRLNGKRKIIVIIGVTIIIFSVVESAQAMDTNYLSPQMVVNITDRDVSRLLKPSINLDIEPKIIMPSSVKIRRMNQLYDLDIKGY